MKIAFKTENWKINLGLGPTGLGILISSIQTAVSGTVFECKGVQGALSKLIKII